MRVIREKLRETQPKSRLSDTREIQLAYQQEMARIFQEALGPDVQMPLPTTPLGIINGNTFLKDVDRMTQKTLPDLGCKPEHIQVLRTLTFLLAQCSRLEATKQNLALFEAWPPPAWCLLPVSKQWVPGSCVLLRAGKMLSVA
jgi:hypothetical protein